MTGSTSSAQNDVTRSFGQSLEQLSSFGTDQNVRGGYWVSLDLRQVGHQGQKVILGSCVNKLGLKNSTLV